MTVFAGVMLATLGSLQILQGLAAVLKDDVFVRGIEYTYKFDVIDLGLDPHAPRRDRRGGRYRHPHGTDLGRRSAGIAIAVVSLLSQFMFMPYYPFWSMLLIFMDIVVVWALATTLGDSGA